MPGTASRREANTWEPALIDFTLVAVASCLKTLGTTVTVTRLLTRLKRTAKKKMRWAMTQVSAIKGQDQL